MPVYKGTLLLEFTGGSIFTGFSESWTWVSPSDAGAINTLGLIPPQRRKWLSSDWKIAGFRLALLTPTVKSGKCVAVQTPVRVDACIGEQQGLLGDADSPYTCVLFDFFRSDKLKPRSYLARGIPDTWWASGGLAIPPADGNKFLSWFNFMKTTVGFGFYKFNKVNCSSAELVTYQSYCSKRIASRRIGRPFALLRGRRSPPA